MVSKHPDFVCVAGANTFGLGANRMYVGRNQLDAATLDRFCVITWDYNTSLESKIGDKHTDYVLKVWALREAASRLQIRAVFGTRKIIMGVSMLKDGDSMADVENEVLWSGVSVDDKAKLQGAVR
jgi:cobaltochelatase CobS